MKIEIDQGDALAPLCADQPATTNRGSRGADPTAAADEYDHLAEPVGRRSDRGRLFFQQGGKRLARGGLYEIIAGAGRKQIAEQPDIVDGAENNQLTLR